MFDQILPAILKLCGRIFFAKQNIGLTFGVVNIPKNFFAD